MKYRFSCIHSVMCGCGTKERQRKIREGKAVSEVRREQNSCVSVLNVNNYDLALLFLGGCYFLALPTYKITFTGSLFLYFLPIVSFGPLV